MAKSDHRPYSLPHGTGGWWRQHFMGGRHRLRGTEVYRIAYDRTYAASDEDCALIRRFASVGLTGRYVWVVATEYGTLLVGYSVPGDWPTGNPRGLAEYSAIGMEYGTSIPASARQELGGDAASQKLMAAVVRVDFSSDKDEPHEPARRHGATASLDELLGSGWSQEGPPATPLSIDSGAADPDAVGCGATAHFSTLKALVAFVRASGVTPLDGSVGCPYDLAWFAGDRL